MQLEVLVSTLNQDKRDFYNKLFENCSSHPKCLVVNQMDAPNPDSANGEGSILKINDVVSWMNLQRKGLSVSRNTAIKNTKADIGVIADDDIVYLPGFEQKVLSYHHTYSDYDIIVFKAVTPDGLPFRKYPEGIKEVTRKIAGGVSSIEMTIKIKAVRDKKLLFDERFGLGAKYPAGEEWIFVMDALKKGLKVLFVPEFIVEHPIYNSGSRFTKPRIMALGATMYRVYGLQAYWRYFIFIKNIRKMHLEFYSVFSFFYFFLKGIVQCQFKRSHMIYE